MWNMCLSALCTTVSEWQRWNWCNIYHVNNPTRLAQCKHSGLCDHWRLVGNEACTAERFQRKQRLCWVLTHCNHLKVTASSTVIRAAAKRQDAYNNSRNGLKKWAKKSISDLFLCFIYFFKAEAVCANKETCSFWKKAMDLSCWD